MNIGLHIFWNVKLNDPINHREIQTSRSDVCTDQNTVLFLTEREVDSHTLLLFLMTLKLIQGGRKPKLSESLINKPDLLARRRKDQHLLLMMCLEERIQDIQLIFWLYVHVILHQLGWSFVYCVDVLLFFFIGGHFAVLDGVEENTFRSGHAFL